MASSDFIFHPYTARVVSLIQSSIREDNKITGSTAAPINYRTFYSHFCLALQTLKSTDSDYPLKSVAWQTDVIRMCELTVTTLTEEQIARCLYAYFFPAGSSDSEEFLALHMYKKNTGYSHDAFDSLDAARRALILREQQFVKALLALSRDLKNETIN